MSKTQTANDRLSPLAESLLREMATRPDHVEYNTRVLGGMFRDEDVARLDSAYKELLQAEMVEHAHAVISFFGKPKTLYRITERGKQRAVAIAGERS
jgi:hypothetical protein